MHIHTNTQIYTHAHELGSVRTARTRESERTSERVRERLLDLDRLPIDDKSKFKAWYAEQLRSGKPLTDIQCDLAQRSIERIDTMRGVSDGEKRKYREVVQKAIDDQRRRKSAALLPKFAIPDRRFPVSHPEQ